MSIINREELQEQIADFYTDSMDIPTMVRVIKDLFRRNYEKMTDEEFQEVINEYEELIS